MQDLLYMKRVESNAIYQKTIGGILNYTLSEKEEIVEEIAERMKDIVFSNAYEKSRQALENNSFFEGKDGDSQVTVFYRIDFIVNDIRQIVARHRRAKEGKCHTELKESATNG